MPEVPAEFASVAVAPCVILQGNGQTIVLPEPTTKSAVAAAAAPILAAEAAAQAQEAARATNGEAIRVKAQQALAGNQTFLALASPTNAQTLAQVKSLTRQMNALIRLQLQQLDDISDT